MVTGLLRKQRQFLSGTVLACILLASCGCGSSKEVKFANVTGIVTLNGAPLPGASIMFIPQRTSESTNVGPPSLGKTDALGAFSLKTPQNVEGAAVGHHRVSISTVVEDPSTREVIVKEILPAEYHSQTVLEFDVPAAGTKAANFELTGKKKNG